ncbi:alpha/beta fold hydrolase [Caulobacter sp. NIBR2454]|uniref:alpha/beta fold hydrolase n=1 Tax=Caulobacter sp. NIBR2454 TaxID=3015996 RepID=UPI0022B64FD2|nr:alpha/beta hydrolase [Caulobacter sp. NIBR2454]
MSALIDMMPPVQYADVNGVRLAYYEAGPRQGVPIILSHGFPELAFSWRHQIKALADAGRWVIAPDQRGYGLTGGPDAVSDYDMAHLTGDLVGLMDHLGVEKAVVCGHDWGGIVVWQMPLMHPDRVAGVISLNTPFYPRPPVDPIMVMRARLGEDMYIVHFQKPGEADAILGRDVAKTMGFMLRRPPTNQGPSAGFATERKEGDGSAFPLVKMVEAYDPAHDTRETFLTPAEFDVFVESFQRTGFTGGINWYRNFTRNWEASADLPTTIDKPSLMVMAELDAVLPPSSADRMDEFIPGLEKALIKGSGHWTQQEQPKAVNEVLIDWLDRRFPL